MILRGVPPEYLDLLGCFRLKLFCFEWVTHPPDLLGMDTVRVARFSPSTTTRSIRPALIMLVPIRDGFTTLFLSKWGGGALGSSAFAEQQ